MIGFRERERGKDVISFVFLFRKCNQLTAFETIYKKYVTTMEDKKKDPCCPLCHRQFNTLQEMQNLVTEVSHPIFLFTYYSQAQF